MTSQQERFWSFEDYREHLQHPDPSVRGWAADRIEQQFPQHLAESLVPLLQDESPNLRVTAAQALWERGKPHHEEALLAALPGTAGNERQWFMMALAKIRSAATLPILIEAVQQTDMQRPDTIFDLRRTTLIEALGNYPEADARKALWRFLSSYPHRDHAVISAFNALLRHPEWNTVPRLMRHVQEFAGTDSLMVKGPVETFAGAALLRKRRTSGSACRWPCWGRPSWTAMTKADWPQQRTRGNAVSCCWRSLPHPVRTSCQILKSGWQHSGRRSYRNWLLF
ncbi:MAG: HEAT repeat domain-containing protein [Chloroflexota bacterium]|nr:HEAT repeat domain-containing protein [Chloroflexota bacterium]